MVNKILMIDEEEKLVHVVRERLSANQFHIYTAYDGLQGFQLAKDKTPDVIIADAMIPVLNGFEFCKAIRQDESTMLIPIIVLIIKNNLQDSFLFLGIKDFVSKPISLEHLEEVVRNKINWSRMMQHQRTKILVHSSKPEILTQSRELLKTVPQWIAHQACNKDMLLENAEKYAPDVILLDLMMPDMNVDDMTRKLRSMPELRNTVILTYYSPNLGVRDHFAVQAQLIEVQFLKNATQEAGANEYLGPFHSARFLDLVNIYRKDFEN